MMAEGERALGRLRTTLSVELQKKAPGQDGMEWIELTQNQLDEEHSHFIICFKMVKLWGRYKTWTPPLWTSYWTPFWTLIFFIIVFFFNF